MELLGIGALLEDGVRIIIFKSEVVVSLARAKLLNPNFPLPLEYLLANHNRR